MQDVVDGIFLGHAASDNASIRETSDDSTFIRDLRQGNSDNIALRMTESGDRVTIIDIDPSVDWKFKTEAAAWKRIVMNLFGNAMKFTKKGQITVKLHLANQYGTGSETAQHICLEVHDTGPGINEDYLKSHLFTPFSQADDISVGTGVGLSIVKRLVEELNGFIDVQSESGLGTCVCVTTPLGDMTSPVNGPDSIWYKEPSLYANGRHKGHTLYIPGAPSSPPEGESDHTTDVSTAATTTTGPDLDMQTFFSNLACRGFGMSIAVVGTFNEDQKQGDASPNSVSLSASTSGGAWTLSRPARGADSGSNCTVVSIRRPFGPRTFASALDEIMAFTAAGTDIIEGSGLKVEMKENRKPESKLPQQSETSPAPEEKHAASPTAQDQHTSSANNSCDSTARPQESNHKTPDEVPPRKSDKTAPHLLLVDDNAVNLKVLAASVKKEGCTYDQATDGRQAVHVFKSSPSPYDLIFMDLSMPVMDGIEATREIRKFEEESTASRKRTQIIALTASDHDKYRQRAFEAGVDDFVIKPVRMARVRDLARRAWEG